MKNPKLYTRMERFVTMFRFVDGVAVWASPRTAVRAFRHRDGVLKEGVACLGRIGEGKEWCWGRRRGTRDTSEGQTDALSGLWDEMPEWSRKPREREGNLS